MYFPSYLCVLLGWIFYCFTIPPGGMWNSLTKYLDFPKNILELLGLCVCIADGVFSRLVFSKSATTFSYSVHFRCMTTRNVQPENTHLLNLPVKPVTKSQKMISKWFLFYGQSSVKPYSYHTCTSRKWVLYFPGYLCVLLGFIFTVWLNFPVGSEIHKQNTCTFLETYMNFSVDSSVLPIVATLYCLVLCRRLFF